MATSPVSTIQAPVFAEPVFVRSMAVAARSSDPTYISSTRKNAATATLTLVPKPETARTREQMLLEVLPVVRYVAYRIYTRLPQSVELDDLVSAGVVGLIDAYNKFDTGKKILFRTYASVRIRGAILDSLRELDWAPRELRRKVRDMEEAKGELMQRLGRRPEASEVAEEMGVTLAAYHELRITVKGLEVGSLQETRTEDSLEEELRPPTADPENDPLHQCLRGERAAHLSAAVAELPEREQRVLQMYYVEEMTLKEIGEVLGVVESRVSQIRTAAIQQLRDFFAVDMTLQQV